MKKSILGCISFVMMVSSLSAMCAPTLYGQDSLVRKNASVKPDKPEPYSSDECDTAVTTVTTRIMPCGMCSFVPYHILRETETTKTGRFLTAHYSGFGLSLINLPKISGDPELSDMVDFGRSIRYDWGFFDSKYRVGLLPLTFVTGLGIQFNSIHFKNKIYVKDVDGKMKVKKDDSDKLRNARLHVTYLTFPMMFEYAFGNQISCESPFFINGGVVLKYRTAQSSKSWWRNDGLHVETRNPGFNPLALDLIAQVGKGNWGFVATYSPLSVTESDQDYRTGMFTFGFKLFFSQR